MPDASPWDAVAARVLELLRGGRGNAAFAMIEQAAMSGGEAAAGPNPGFREVGLALYWKHRALPEFLTLQREHRRRLEAALAACDNPTAASPLVRALAGSYYNLASFAWPGWDEAGIVIGPEELAAGRDAALRCLDLRRNPAHAAVPFGYTPAMAHWMVGAYHLAAREWDAARAEFGEARRLNREAGAVDVLEAGYLALCDALERPDDPSASAAFAAVITQLEARDEDEDAACYRQQLLSARRVFGGGETAAVSGWSGRA
jgi:hypothetical protein